MVYRDIAVPTAHSQKVAKAMKVLISLLHQLGNPTSY